MSTTIKRIALVAVAALSLGVMTSAPSNAAPSAAYGTYIGDSATGQQEINSLAQIVISYNETITEVTTSGVGSVVTAVATTGDSLTISAVAANGSFTITDADAAQDTGTVTVTLSSAVAGVQTLSMTPYTATGSRGTAVTKTVTWVTTLSKNTYDKSLAFITGDTGTSVSTFLSADTNTAASATAALNFPSTPSNTVSKARLQVKQFAVGDTTTTSTLATGKGKEVTFAITTAGVLGSAANAASASTITIPAASYVAGQSQEVFVFADGRTGAGQLTVTVGGVLVATKTITFTGTTTKYVVGSLTGDALSKKYAPVSAAAATVKFNGVDALNNVAELAPTITHAITSDATIATVSVTGSSNVVTIAGVKAGKVMVYAANAATLATATIVSPGVEVEITGSVAKTVTFSYDKSTYNPGEKITLSINAVDANGRPLADGSYALLAETATANLNLVGSLPGPTSALVNGKADYTFYAPASSGDLIITAKEGSATASTTKAAIAGGTVSVSNGAVDAAADAANQAAELAQDAADAAVIAADAADEATAAVEALSLEVNTLIKGLKAQLTTLYKMFIKLRNSLK